MTRGDAVRDLAAALRNENNVSAAVATWIERFGHAPSFARVARRLRLDCDAGRAFSGLAGVLGDDARALGALLHIAHRTGCSAAPAVEALAAAIDARARDRAAGQAAATAARNSARAMVLMPLLGLPPLVLAGVSIGDTSGIGFVFIAVGLMYAGWRWIERLIPDPPRDDDGVRFCELLACGLAGGLTPARACAEIAGLFPGLTEPARRLVDLGLTWPDALARSKQEVARRAGALVVRMQRSGTPVAAELTALARARRREVQHAFDIAVKAAPVRMIWPLVACSLPAFCALTVLPLVRGIASSL